MLTLRLGFGVIVFALWLVKGLIGSRVHNQRLKPGFVLFLDKTRFFPTIPKTLFPFSQNKTTRF